MSKVKIVQIAFTGEGSATEYLDDQGRIWCDNGKFIVDEEHSVRGKWQQNWVQVELPEEPEL
jgi:hypothetical protein